MVLTLVIATAWLLRVRKFLQFRCGETMRLPVVVQAQAPGPITMWMLAARQAA
jgi:hypothetical protein